MSKVILSILCFLFSYSAIAQTSTTIHHHYQAPRALGMGDAFVAVADDYSGLFYNPAGLARRDRGQVNLSMSYGATPGALDFYNGYKDIGDNSSLSETDKQQKYLELIERHYGDVYSFRTSPLEGFWVRPNWGMAFIPLDLSVELAMHKSVGPSINATVYADTTLAYGYGNNIYSIPGQFSWGITGKFVNRGYMNKRVTALDLAGGQELISKNDLAEGYTIDADLGVLWTPEIHGDGFFSSALRMARPTFGAVVRNIAETGFGSNLKLLNKEPGENVPEKMYRVFDLGSRWEYPQAWIFGGRGVLDIRDIGHPDFNWRKGLHLGLEFDWTVTSWWKGHYRVGLNQGFWTAGLSAELGIFNLDLVSYANDVGTRNTPIESRVYATRLNLDF